MPAPSLGPWCQLIEPWNILDLDLWVSLVPGMARRRSQLRWSDMEQDGKEIYLQTWSKTHSNEQNSTNSNGLWVKTRKIKPLKKTTLRLEKCSLVAQHCDCELRDKIQDTFCLKTTWTSWPCYSECATWQQRRSMCYKWRLGHKSCTEQIFTQHRAGPLLHTLPSSRNDDYK